MSELKEEARIQRSINTALRIGFSMLNKIVESPQKESITDIIIEF